MPLPVPGIHVPTPFANCTLFSETQLRHLLLGEVLLPLTPPPSTVGSPASCSPGSLGSPCSLPSQFLALRAEAVPDLPSHLQGQSEHLALLLWRLGWQPLYQTQSRCSGSLCRRPTHRTRLRPSANDFWCRRSQTLVLRRAEFEHFPFSLY